MRDSGWEAPTVLAEIAWAAGFTDGEGWIGFSGGMLILEYGQTERRSLERLGTALGLSARVLGPYERRGRDGYSWAPVFKLRVTGPKAAAALRLLWPHLGYIKRRQALEAARRYRAWTERPTDRAKPDPTGERCGRGHSYDPANTYRRADGRRYCRACKRERAAS